MQKVAPSIRTTREDPRSQRNREKTPIGTWPPHPRNVERRNARARYCRLCWYYRYAGYGNRWANGADGETASRQLARPKSRSRVKHLQRTVTLDLNPSTDRERCRKVSLPLRYGPTASDNSPSMWESLHGAHAIRCVCAFDVGWRPWMRKPTRYRRGPLGLIKRAIRCAGSDSGIRFF